MFSIFFLISIFVVFYLPSIFLPWSLIDDGQRLLVGKDMTKALVTGRIGQYLLPQVDKSLGRFRPAYWIYHHLKYVVFGQNSFLHHSFRLLLYVLLLYLLFSLLSNIKSKTYAKTILVLISTSLASIMNIWRLGTQEFLLMIWLVISIWCLVKYKNLILAIIFSFLAFATKEVFFYLTPSFIVLLIFYNSDLDTKQKKYLIFNTLLASISLLTSLYLSRKGYAAETTFHPTKVFQTLSTHLKNLCTLGYCYIGAITLLSFFYDLSTRRQLPPFIWFNLIAGFSYLIVQSFWPHPLIRYLFPFIIHISIVIAYYFSRSMSLDSERKQNIIVRLLWTISLVTLLFYSILSSILFITSYYQRESVNRIMVKEIAQLSNDDTMVFFDFSPESGKSEWMKETGQHLKLFYSISPSVDFTRDKNRRKLRENELIITWDNYGYLTQEESRELYLDYDQIIIYGYYREPVKFSKALSKLINDPFENNFLAEITTTKQIMRQIIY